MGAGHLCKVNIITLATPLPSPVINSLMMVLTIVTLGPRLSLATPSWCSATGTEQDSFLDTWHRL